MKTNYKDYDFLKINMHKEDEKKVLKKNMQKKLWVEKRNQ